MCTFIKFCLYSGSGIQSSLAEYTFLCSAKSYFSVFSVSGFIIIPGLLLIQLSLETNNMNVMEVVEILLFFFVGFSVMVFFIIHKLDSLEQKRKTCYEQKRSKVVKFHDSQSNTGVGSVVTESLQFCDEHEHNTSVGGACEAETHILSKNSGEEESLEIEEPDQKVTNCSEESGFRDGLLEISTEDSNEKGREIHMLRDNKGDDGEEEDEFLDDWEGIERTEMEKRFGDAVVFVGSKNNEDRIDKDLKLQLYGLHKVALEGPCRLPQPMALKVSARAKWNSWQSLGNMNRELAMEQYVMLLSRASLGWKVEGTPASQDAGTSDYLASHYKNEYEEDKRLLCVNDAYT
ncbi:acyl-CoA-binding domain-containing protein 3-like [Forsythia ovata]|uniref:Acyl-CoA-binding domain-containing protein 3-like n=1 Tax=Forsythia ovata TaxID=205694 RepID=A0ABD1UTH1_9LAMI